MAGRQAPPPLTYEQRLAASKKAADARRARYDMRRGIKTRAVDSTLALEDPTVKRMPVRLFIEALPGVGKETAGDIMYDLGLLPHRRISGLGCRQMARLKGFLADLDGNLASYREARHAS